MMWYTIPVASFWMEGLSAVLAEIKDRIKDGAKCQSLPAVFAKLP